MCSGRARRGHKFLFTRLFVYSMPQFYSFEDIESWKESRKLLWSIRQVCKREHVKRDYNFIDQITASARSISANIAEGNDAMTPLEFIQFLGYAKRSAAETRSHFYDALDERYISQKEFVELTMQTRKICGMLAKLIHHLQAEKLRPRTFRQT